MATNETAPAGPVLFAYDGSELAAYAFTHAAAHFAPGQEALVVCVYQPADVGFVLPKRHHLDADQATDVKAAAEETAAHGAELATQAGFQATGKAVWSAPTWKGLVQTAEETDASMIVIASHRRPHGLRAHFVGSVAAAVVAHAECSVLVVHDHQAEEADHRH
jgi:nucleotide-binding universal stress UspA family protein